MSDQTDPLDRSIRARRLLFVGLFITAIASVLGLLRVLTIAIGKVRSGQGLETYRTFWLIDFNFIGARVVRCGRSSRSGCSGVLVARGAPVA
jgi:hypothetical protein